MTLKDLHKACAYFAICGIRNRDCLHATENNLLGCFRKRDKTGYGRKLARTIYSEKYGRVRV